MVRGEVQEDTPLHEVSLIPLQRSLMRYLSVRYRSAGARLRAVGCNRLFGRLRDTHQRRLKILPMQRTEIGVVCVFEMASHFVVTKAAIDRSVTAMSTTAHRGVETPVR
jgi:hypothetical protein